MSQHLLTNQNQESNCTLQCCRLVELRCLGFLRPLDSAPLHPHIHEQPNTFSGIVLLKQHAATARFSACRPTSATQKMVSKYGTKHKPLQCPILWVSSMKCSEVPVSTDHADHAETHTGPGRSEVYSMR